MYTVAQVADSEFPHSWHEAVAIVQEVASQLDPEVAVPALEDLLLDDNGTLSFGFASESTDSPVTGLGRLLKALLQGTGAPPGLRELAEENGREKPAQPTIAGFCRALSFYERPNRASDLLAVAGRLAAVRVHRSADDVVERLRAQFEAPEPSVGIAEAEFGLEDESAEAPAPATDLDLRSLLKTVADSPEPRKYRWRFSRGHERTAAAVAGLAAILIFMAGFAASGGILPPDGVANGEQPPSPPPLPIAAPLGIAERSPAALLFDLPPDLQPVATNSSITESAGSSREIRAGGAVERPGRDAVSAARRQPPAASRVASHPGRPASLASTAGSDDRPARDPVDPIPGRPPGTVGNSVPMTERPNDRTLGPPPAPPAEPGRPTGALYTSKDPRVQPPRLMRPQLPSEPAPVATTGFFDIIVNERGLVEQVKLLSPTGHYHDRMLVAAAKAWRFRPAMLDGRAVRFRMLVPITVPEKK